MSELVPSDDQFWREHYSKEVLEDFTDRQLELLLPYFPRLEVIIESIKQEREQRARED